MATFIEGNHLTLTPDEAAVLGGALKYTVDEANCHIWAGATEQEIRQARDSSEMVETTVPSGVKVYQGRRGKPVAPVKVAVAVKHGILYNGASKWVRQTCGNPMCVNPEHAQVVDAPAYYRARVRAMNPAASAKRVGSVAVSLKPVGTPPQSSQPTADAIAALTAQLAERDRQAAEDRKLMLELMERMRHLSAR